MWFHSVCDTIENVLKDSKTEVDMEFLWSTSIILSGTQIFFKLMKFLELIKFLNFSFVWHFFEYFVPELNLFIDVQVKLNFKVPVFICYQYSQFVDFYDVISVIHFIKKKKKNLIKLINKPTKKWMIWCCHRISHYSLI